MKQLIAKGLTMCRLFQNPLRLYPGIVDRKWRNGLLEWDRSRAWLPELVEAERVDLGGGSSRNATSNRAPFATPDGRVSAGKVSGSFSDFPKRKLRLLVPETGTVSLVRFL